MIKIDINKGYRIQNEMVIFHLVNDSNFKLSPDRAAKLWFESKTRHVIQEVEQAYWVSPARCLDELIMEINNDPMWNTDIYD